jgi:hypothetical protein
VARTVDLGDLRRVDLRPAPSDPIRLESQATAADSGPAETGPAETGPIGDGRPAVAPGQQVDRPAVPRMVERIEAWVRHSENAPPPRSITLRGAELNGLTVRVSMTGDGLAIQVEGAGGDDLAWIRQVIDRLTERGHQVTEFTDYEREGRRRPIWDEEAADQRRRRGRFTAYLEEQLV